MQLPVFREGISLLHPERGPCRVVFIGNDYVGVELSSGASALLMMNSFIHESGKIEEIGYQAAAGLFWPESTFVFESSEDRPSLALRWKPFFDDEAELMMQLHEIVPQGNPWIGFGESRESSRKMPVEWSQGVALTSPNQRQGLIMFIRIDQEEGELMDVFPFFSSDSHHSLRVRRVIVRPNGVEAKIEAVWSHQEIVFFDIGFLVNRLWYQTGKICEFSLTGLAYTARPADFDAIERERSVAQSQGEEALPPAPTGADISVPAVFQKAGNGDIDDYDFRGVAREVNAIRGDILGQTGWVVSVAVMAGLVDDVEDDDNDDERCLDILITHRAWQGEAPPAEGQVIEGRCWLQGYLRYASKERTDWHIPVPNEDGV